MVRTLISRVLGTNYQLSMKSRPLYHSWPGRDVFRVSDCVTARKNPGATFTIGVQRGFLAGSNVLIFQKLEKTRVRTRRKLQIRRTNLSRKP